MNARPHRAVSLFSNCGAGDIGYAKAGFRFDVMAELDPRRLEVCLLNHPDASGVAGDLTETWPDVVSNYRKAAGETRPALVAACPPCQGMSSARSHRGFADDADAGTKDSRNLLVTVIVEVVRKLNPKILVVENVQAFLRRRIRHPSSGLPITAAKLLVEGLEDYAAFPMVTDLCDFGVPQTRKRTFITFINRDVPGLAKLTEAGLAPYPMPDFAPDLGGKPITIRKALRGYGLPNLDAASKKKAMSRVGAGLHSVPVWMDRRYEMVAAIPPHSGKSAWSNNVCEDCGRVRVGPDRASCPRCRGPLLRPVVRQKNGSYRLIHGFRSSTYSRMASDEPAATITTASGHIGSNHTIHPYQNRLLSTLECAFLQSIPRGFDWGDALAKWGHTNVRDMIGEAVPPLFTKLHGKVLSEILSNDNKTPLLSTMDFRCTRAQKRMDSPPPRRRRDD
jgi:DNA (cytosine-5)-methyltransferase 1